ncbi:ABC-F family ATP-binding cassette domain-containing protein [Lachnoclostridium phytofermentans]|uniref:ABC transporter related n=1 Tax=Lachnoclostridium phytofermentans (strain ATCC 700394 / DSM 18823 / ISDg) TaxID=357809 RepID=A9KM74_LACP7|nr:ABC-F family ATP-binding cassette domain-containing protein [Lachnoclostridium phytofermentans]ABX41417.1 ABC transporter related [Lachnoclostridium phytofermentans ISDg]
MSLLEINNVSHAYGEKTLYKQVSLEFYQGEHIGIVGSNGAGKSTLIQMMIGEVIPDQGYIRWQNGIRTGYLDQYAKMEDDISIIQYLKTAFSELYQVETELTNLYEKLSEAEDVELYYNKINAYQQKLEDEDFYQIDSRISKIVTGLGIDAFNINSLLGKLSGGQRAKVILAKLLLNETDVLILDEPTNFLDKEHVVWLAEYLKNYKGSYFVVSHNYEFLEQSGSDICDIEFGTMKKYGVRYSEFLKLKEKQKEDYIKRYTLQQEEIKRTEEFIRKNIAGIKTKMAQGRRTRLERMERLEKPNFQQKVHLNFLWVSPAASPALVIKNLEVGYDKVLLPSINLTMMSSEKIAITGFNGIGKSTLLKTLVGYINSLGGAYRFSDTVTLGYFEQELSWEDSSKTPFQIVMDYDPAMKREQIRRKLSEVGIKSEHIEKEIRLLSGGEQAKVKLCLLLLKPCNFLILDEPTNHLDQEAKEGLKSALEEFSGNIILVSHEEKFYSGLVDRVIKITK